MMISLLSSVRCRLGIAVLLLLEVLVTVTDSQTTNTTSCYCLQKLLSGLQSPVHLERAQIRSRDVYLVAQQSGMILQYDPLASSSNKLKPYLDLTSNIVVSSDPGDERGLLGFALHPNFTTNQKIYIYSTRSVSLLEYIAVTEISGTDLATEKYLLLVEQPGTRQNGGQLLFGQDGYLYIITGDGGPPESAENQAQNPRNLLGKILRVDVDRTTVADYKIQYYGIPPNNPRREGWRPEVYGLGVRNMWRCSMDRGDPKTGAGKGRIFCGELGTSIADEINLLVPGGNYGWNYREGLQCVNQTLCDMIGPDEQLPIYTLNRTTSRVVAVVGGPLYRGSKFPELQGQYVYGDFASTSITSLNEMPEGSWTPSGFTACDTSVCDCHSRDDRMTYLLSIAESAEGELYLLMTNELQSTAPKGGLFQLVPPSTKSVTCSSSELEGVPLAVLLSVAIFIQLLKKNAHL